MKLIRRYYGQMWLFRLIRDKIHQVQRGIQTMLDQYRRKIDYLRISVTDRCDLRTAVAAGRVTVNENTFALIKNGGMKKGDVLAVAQVAGIMAAKHTPDIIPMCHPVLIDGIDISLTLDEARLSVEITASASCAGHTGVEMEALTAVSAAALTVYDMCKAVQKDILISDIHLLEKTGGVHGDYSYSGK